MTCAACPHPTDCASLGNCLTDRAAPWIARKNFSRWMLPQQARDVEAALRAGKSFRQITNGSKDTGPAIVTSVKWHTHMTAYPIWGAEMKALAAANAKAHDANKGSHMRKRTHCRNGHPFGDLTKVFPNGWVKRRCPVCELANRRRGHLPSIEVVGQAMARMLAGKSISSFTLGGSPGYLMPHKDFKLCRATYPAFDRMAAEHIAGSNSRGQKLRFANSPQPKKVKPAAASNLRTGLTGIIAAQPHDLFTAIDAAVPRNLPRFIRDDVMGELAEMVLAGDLDVADLAAAARRLTGKQYSAINFGPVSLDAPAYRDSAIPLIETISEGLWA